MFTSPMPKKDTVQFHIRPARAVVNDLEALSKRFKRDSANQVAAEILRDYSQLWAAAEQAKLDTIERQTDAVTRAIREEALRGTLHEAKADPDAKPLRRKRGNE